MTHVMFNPPPGWPPPPPGWMPPLGWQPPTEWPTAPDDWVLYLEEPPEYPAPAELRTQQTAQESTWWGDGAGYHTAYYVSGTATPSRLGLGAGTPVRNLPPSGRGGRLLAGNVFRRPGWPRRLLFALSILGLLLLIVPLVNNPISRAISICENAVVTEAARLAAPATTDGEVSAEEGISPLDAGPAASYARSDLRYTLGANTNPDQVTILGNYFAPDGAWMTFSCTARHAPEPAQVLDLTVSPVGTPPVTP